MSDHAKLIAVAQEILDRTEGQIGTHFTDCHKYHLACFAAFVMRALEAVQQAPAVEADGLVGEIRAAYVEYAESADFPTQKHYEEWKAAGGAEREFDSMIAEVEARGLEKAEKIARDVEAEAVVKRDESDYPESHYGQHLDGQARGAQVVAQRIAQQVMEGN